MGIKRSQVQNLIIYFGDIIGITIGYFLMAYLRYKYDNNIMQILNPMVTYRWLIAIFVVTLIYMLSYPNKEFFKRKFWQEFFCNMKTNILAAALMATIAYLIDDARDYSRFIYLMTMAFSFWWMQITHCFYRWYILNTREYSQITRKMLIVTTSKHAEEVLQNVMKEKTWNLWITGVAIVDADMVGQTILDIPVVANKKTMLLYATRSVVDEVFVHIPYYNDSMMKKLIQEFHNMGITVSLNIQMFDMEIDTNKRLDSVGKYPTVTFAPREICLQMIIIKRFMDIVGAIVGLAVTVLAAIIIGPIIKIQSPGPLFFSQKRVGRNGRIFKIYKFRSMYADAEERKKELMEQNEMDGLMFKMKDDPRITPIGKFIRKTSLDELPQFWNVLKGDMSLVGTRPPTVDEFEQYEGYHKMRLSMTPGLTGVWQVSGRSDITDFEEVVAMDVDYIKNWSLKKDIEIILRTFKVVLCSSGAR